MTEKQKRYMIARLKDHEGRLARMEKLLLSSAMDVEERVDITTKAVACGEDTISPSQSINQKHSMPDHQSPQGQSGAEQGAQRP